VKLFQKGAAKPRNGIMAANQIYVIVEAPAGDGQMANDGASTPSADGQPSLEDEVRELTFQLEELVRELEIEIGETGSVSSNSAARLQPLRLRFQRLRGQGF
jgi:hypothetical protein